MPTGTTGTAERTNSLQALLSIELEKEAARTQIWGQFPWVPSDGVISGADAGQTVTLRFLQNMPLATGTINEKADIQPVTQTDNAVSVTIDEYGNAQQTARFAELVTKGDLRAETGANVAENMVSSLDRKAGRQYYEGNDLVFRANDAATRAGLDSTNDVLSNSGVGMPFTTRAVAALRGAKVPGFSADAGGMQKYMTVIHTALAQDLPDTNGYLAALQNREGSQTIFNGEMGEIRGLRITESHQGKVYPGAGDAAQSATALTNSASAGDTTITVDTITGLAAGNIITIGTLEPGTSATEAESEVIENVRVVSVAGDVITLTGLGYSDGDISTGGLRYDHASGISVIEADLVAAMPVFGPKSVMKAYAAEVGPFGKATVTGPFDTLGRFVNVGWYAVQGWAAARRLYSVRLELATVFPHIVVNE